MDFILLGYEFKMGNISFPLNDSPGLIEGLTLDDIKVTADDLGKKKEKIEVIDAYGTTEAASVF